MEEDKSFNSWMVYVALGLILLVQAMTFLAVVAQEPIINIQGYNQSLPLCAEASAGYCSAESNKATCSGIKLRIKEC